MRKSADPRLPKFMEQHVTCHETVSEQNSDTQAPGGGNQDARPEAGGRRKVRWRSSSPLRGSPPLTWPRMAMPFDRPPASGLFAPRISDTNKWCRIHVTQASGGGNQDANCEAPERTSPTSWCIHVTGHSLIALYHYLRPQSRTSVRI